MEVCPTFATDSCMANIFKGLISTVRESWCVYVRDTTHTNMVNSQQSNLYSSTITSTLRATPRTKIKPHVNYMFQQPSLNLKPDIAEYCSGKAVTAPTDMSKVNNLNDCIRDYARPEVLC